MQSPWIQKENANLEHWETTFTESLRIVLTINRDNGLCRAQLTEKDKDVPVHTETFHMPLAAEPNGTGVPAAAQRLAVLLLIAWAAQEAKRLAGYVDVLISISPNDIAQATWYTPYGFDPTRHVRKISANMDVSLDRQPDKQMAPDSWILTMNGEDMGYFSAPTADTARTIADQILATIKTREE